ncbi:MAG: phosphohydrolase [Acidobacteria bacterium]|nr:MAG: phosphohydrolase [Acidobacteriota bacterium]
MLTATTQRVEDGQALRYRFMEMEDRYRKQALAMACALISLVDLRDAYTGGHSSRVASYARATALRLGLPDGQLDKVVMGALLHDIGKIGVPDHVLLKRGRLTDEEFAHIKKHPELGWMALKNIEDFKPISLIVLHHHERMDGVGYPGGLKGNAIPLGSRIIAVADSYDALTTDRPYRTARTKQQAIDELLRCVDVQFDSRVLAAFLDALD